MRLCHFFASDFGRAQAYTLPQKHCHAREVALPYQGVTQGSGLPFGDEALSHRQCNTLICTVFTTSRFLTC
jgi:hypothetical protein